MKKSKKILSLILCISFVLCFGVFSACSPSTENASDSTEDRLSIVCTIFPQYDWIKQILGDEIDNVDLTMMLDSGVDLHSYQPTADDIIKISNCDVFVYVGGESDKWVDDIINNSENKNMVVIDLIDVLGDSVKEEEIVDGMQEDEHEHEDEDGHDDEVEYDEHVWLSLKNAKILCAEIAQRLGEADSKNSDKYINNSNAYIEKLDNLDKQYQDAVNNAGKNTLLFADRFPFRYLADDYSINYYAAFAGCSAETEASFETISFLANKADELGLNAVITIEGADHSIAETVIKNTQGKNQSILSLDSMQSTTLDDVKNGVTYLSIMQDNLSVLQEALA